MQKILRDIFETKLGLAELQQILYMLKTNNLTDRAHCVERWCKKYESKNKKRQSRCTDRKFFYYKATDICKECLLIFRCLVSQVNPTQSLQLISENDQDLITTFRDTFQTVSFSAKLGPFGTLTPEPCGFSTCSFRLNVVHMRNEKNLIWPYDQAISKYIGRSDFGQFWPPFWPEARRRKFSRICH